MSIFDITTLSSSIICFILAISLYIRSDKKSCNEGTKPSEGVDLSIYILMVMGVLFISTFFVVNFVPDFYRYLVATDYLVITSDSSSPSNPGNTEGRAQTDDIDKGLGVGELLTLIGILTGIPVAFAGSIYAIFLARQAQQTSASQFEAECEKRLQEVTEKITSNFSSFADRLLEVNVSAGSVFERTNALLNPIMLGASEETLRECAEIIDREELPRLKESINELRNSVTEIRGHDLSTEVLLESLSEKRSSLAATYFTDPSKFVQPKRPWTWLSYRSASQSPSLVDALELLRFQASRLRGADVIAGMLESAMITAAWHSLEHLDISDKGIQLEEIFDSSWLNGGTRIKEEAYYFRGLGRILRTESLRRESTSRLPRTINVGAAILEDMYRIIPTKSHISHVVQRKGVAKRLDEMNKTILKEHFESITYAGNSLFPLYFTDALEKSLLPNQQHGGEPLLVLRLPAYFNRINSMVRGEIENPGDLKTSFNQLLREYLCESVIDASMHPGTSESNGVDSIVAPEKNAGTIAAHPIEERRVETLRAFGMLAFSRGSVDATLEYASRAEIAAKGNRTLENRCALDLGDYYAFLSGRAESIPEARPKAHAAYSRAFDQGKPISPAQLSEWIEGLLRKLPHSFFVQGQVLTANEVASENGMLPILCGVLFKPDDIAYRLDLKALCEVRTEFVSGFRPPACIEMIVSLQDLFTSLPRHENHGYRFDELYDAWFSRIKNGEFSILQSHNDS